MKTEKQIREKFEHYKNLLYKQRTKEDKAFVEGKVIVLTWVLEED